MQEGLAIVQKRKSNYTDNTLDETVVFYTESMKDAAELVDNLIWKFIEKDSETIYKIETVGKIRG